MNFNKNLKIFTLFSVAFISLIATSSINGFSLKQNNYQKALNIETGKKVETYEYGNIAYVSNWTDFRDAAINNDIKTIKLIADIDLGNNPESIPEMSNKNIIGNGYSFIKRGYSL